MKFTKALLLLLLLPAILLLYTSCKKSNTDSIRMFLTGGAWEVSSIMVFNYVGDTQLPTDTLNDSCTVAQVFKFNLDETCTYTNYHCIEQSATGRWSLSRDRIFLVSDLACRDTGETAPVKPFENTRIVNLGQYSMVLQTGDLQSNYFPNQRRRIVQYGFVRQKNTSGSN